MPRSFQPAITGACHQAPAALAASPLIRIFLSLALVALAVIASAGRLAAETVKTIRISQVESGSLLLRTDKPGRYLRAPAVKTHVRMEISGLIARVTVSQSFTNPSKQWIEGVYVFPLPANAGVDRLRMRVGDRFIEGKIKERGEARKLYEQAKAAGIKTALVEQQRPNIFTNSIANIGPGETVLVQITYQQTLRYDAGAFALRFPMVVGPRYIPSGEKIVAFNGAGWGRNTLRVPDASRITPPVLNPKAGKRNPVTLEITLKPGFPLAWVKSETHKLRITANADGSKRIVFDAKSTFTEKDFVLRWQPRIGAAPGAGLFTEIIDGKIYALLMVMPPRGKIEGLKRTRREVIFVIDTSGSMSGTSILQARAALQLALDRLAPGDSFNIIEFNSLARGLFAQARPVSRSTIAQAKSFIAGLTARGGTEMLKALNLALDGGRDKNRLRQVIFLTDGSVGNEAQLFRAIKARLGDSRLFTVGIGSAPNSHFMTKAAQYGRGNFTYISRVAEVKKRMSEMFAKIEEPVLTDIRVRFPASAGAQAWPRKIPDLYRGEPVILAVRLDKLDGKVEIAGRFAGKQWKLALPLSGGQPGAGVGAVWARAKIAAYTDRLHEGASRAQVRAGIIKVALAHRLVSKFTSLIAIDVTPSRPKGQAAVTRAVPVNLPAGWDFEKVFGQQNRQRKADNDKRRIDTGVAGRRIARKREMRLRSPQNMAQGKYRAKFNAKVPASPRSVADAAAAGKPSPNPAAAVSRNKTPAAKPGKPPVLGAKDAKQPLQVARTARGGGKTKPPKTIGFAASLPNDLYLLLGLLFLVVVGPMLWPRRRKTV
ncbi:MAG: marine proteobacterial sortase target protein [Alphaproteobacteria bacterium]